MSCKPGLFRIFGQFSYFTLHYSPQLAAISLNIIYIYWQKQKPTPNTNYEGAEGQDGDKNAQWCEEIFIFGLQIHAKTSDSSHINYIAYITEVSRLGEGPERQSEQLKERRGA
jgi:hypothetical protein